MDRLIGTPWREMSCVELVNNRCSSIPNLDGSKWGKILWLPRVELWNVRAGDILVWWTSETWHRDPRANDRSPSGILPCHAAILVVPEERLMLHSGISDGDHGDGWPDRAKAEIAEHEELRDGGHWLFQARAYRR